jgi:hypothetical protein
MGYVLDIGTSQGGHGGDDTGRNLTGANRGPRAGSTPYRELWRTARKTPTNQFL